jgi:hypothetical protein
MSFVLCLSANVGSGPLEKGQRPLFPPSAAAIANRCQLFTFTWDSVQCISPCSYYYRIVYFYYTGPREHASAGGREQDKGYCRPRKIPKLSLYGSLCVCLLMEAGVEMLRWVSHCV